jgi:protease I
LPVDDVVADVLVGDLAALILPSGVANPDALRRTAVLAAVVARSYSPP